MLIPTRLIGRLHQRSISSPDSFAWGINNMNPIQQNNTAFAHHPCTMLLSVGQSANTYQLEYEDAVTACH
jgi:hypothetical protein